MLVNKFPHSSKDKSPSRAVIVTAISPDYSSDLRAFVTKIAGQFIADGMVLLVDQKSPMPTEDNPKFSTFVNSFVSDLFIQGLNTSVHRMNALSAIDSRDTIFVTSR